MRGRVLSAASCLAFAASIGGTARAQDNSSQEAEAIRDNTIIVTAQFREQSLQETPIAISAISSETLEQKGVTDIVGAANLAPNVQLSSNAGNFGGVAAIFIRGVGQADPHFAVEPGVGMYIDDVYYGVLTGSVFDLLDVDRVEVLRGPQGTLAGKNSIGGAIKMFSMRPGPDPDGFIEVGYGSRNSIVGRAATNVTLSDNLHGRISFGARYSDGYLDRIDYNCATGNTSGGTARLDKTCKIGTQGGKQVYSGRGALLWEPSDTIENLLSFDMTRDRSENPAAKMLTSSPVIPGDPPITFWAGLNDYFTPDGSYTNYENYQSLPTGGSAAGVPFAMPDTTPLNSWGVSNNLRINLSDDISLTSITAFRKSDITLAAAVDASPASVNDQIWSLDHEQFTQELRLSGTVGEFLDWTVGGFYYDASGESGGRVNIPGGIFPGGGGVNLDILFGDPVDTTSKSVFAHTIWHPLPGLSVTGAVRYTDDKKAFTFNRWDVDGVSTLPGLEDMIDYTVTYKGDRVDWRVAADYQWSEDFMTYAQVSTGYKGGGVNPRPFVSSQALSYEPEELTAYELGFKSQFLDRRVTLNAAAFYNEYKNFQGTLRVCSTIAPPAPDFACAQSTNIGDAEIRGFEAELFLEPVDGFTLDASLGYVDFEYTSVDTARTGITLDMTNVYSPKWTVAAGAQYELPLGGGAGTIIPRVDVNYRSSMETDPINNDLAQIDPLTLFGASLTWRSEDEDWQAMLSVENLGDKFYYNSKFLLAIPPYWAGTGQLGAPRTFMFTVKRRFD